MPASAALADAENLLTEIHDRIEVAIDDFQLTLDALRVDGEVRFASVLVDRKNFATLVR